MVPDLVGSVVQSWQLHAQAACSSCISKLTHQVCSCSATQHDNNLQVHRYRGQGQGKKLPRQRIVSMRKRPSVQPSSAS